MRLSIVGEVQVISVGRVLCSHGINLFDVRTHRQSQTKVLHSLLGRVDVARDLLIGKSKLLAG